MVAAVINANNMNQQRSHDINDDNGSSRVVKNTPKKAAGGTTLQHQHQQQQQRVFIGNLPNSSSLDGLMETQLLQLLNKTSVQDDDEDDSFKKLTTKDIQVIQRRSKGNTNNCIMDDDNGDSAASADAVAAAAAAASGCHAFITCPTKSVADTLITALQGVEFQGRCLIVQEAAEKKQHQQGSSRKIQSNKNHRNYVKQQRGGAKNASSQATNPFGKRSWVKPSISTSSSSSLSPSLSLPEKSSATKVAAMEEEHQQQQQQQQQQSPPNSLEEASERLEGLVSQQMKDAQKDLGGSDGDDDALTAAMIGTVAAVSLVASLNGFGVVVPSVHDDNDDDDDDDDNNNNNNNNNSGASFPAAAAAAKKPESATTMSFLEQCRQQSVNTLMEDYGEFDPSWKEQQQPASPQPTVLDSVYSAPETKETDTNITKNEKNYGTTRLGQHGKAPIHVELTSFGYKYGAPGASKKQHGWSHAQPLAPFDCRHVLQPVPSFLAWRDGLNGQVKRALLSADKNIKSKDDNDNYNDDDDDDSPGQNISVYTQDIANEISKALLEAINDGGHGYAMPLKMVIYVGSELGRHRSVVACELAATALRKQLRANCNDCYQQPCSVGTRHLHLDKKQPSDTVSAAARLKKKSNTTTDNDVAYENNKLGNW